MALSVRSFAHQYSKQCVNKLTRLLLDRSYRMPHNKATDSGSTQDFELDLEVVYDHSRKVEDILIK